MLEFIVQFKEFLTAGGWQGDIQLHSNTVKPLTDTTNKSTDILSLEMADITIILVLWKTCKEGIEPTLLSHHQARPAANGLGKAMSPELPAVVQGSRGTQVVSPYRCHQ